MEHISKDMLYGVREEWNPCSAEIDRWGVKQKQEEGKKETEAYSSVDGQYWRCSDPLFVVDLTTP